MHFCAPLQYEVCAPLRYEVCAPLWYEAMAAKNLRDYSQNIYHSYCMFCEKVL